MSQIKKIPLTPEQIKKRETVSEEKIREAQDALFLFLLQRVDELEKQLNPPDEEV